MTVNQSYDIKALMKEVIIALAVPIFMVFNFWLLAKVVTVVGAIISLLTYLGVLYIYNKAQQCVKITPIQPRPYPHAQMRTFLTLVAVGVIIAYGNHGDNFMALITFASLMLRSFVFRMLDNIKANAHIKGGE